MGKEDKKVVVVTIVDGTDEDISFGKTRNGWWRMCH